MQLQFSGEEEETFPPTGEIQELFDAELLQQISCEAFVSPRTNHKEHTARSTQAQPLAQTTIAPSFMNTSLQLFDACMNRQMWRIYRLQMLTTERV